MNKLKTGDEVIVITGKDKGKRGVIQSIIAGKKVMIDGLNLVKKHVKPNPELQIQGGIVKQSKPLDISNVMLYDPVSKKGSKVGFRVLQDGRRVRFCKASGELVGSKE